MTFFVRPIIRPPANLYKNDGGGGGAERGGVQNSCIPKWPIFLVDQDKLREGGTLRKISTGGHGRDLFPLLRLCCV